MAGEEPNVGNGGLVGSATSSGGELAQFRAKFKVDIDQMTKLVTGFDNIKKKIKEVEDAAASATDKINNLGGAIGSATGASTGSKSATSTAGAIASATAASKAQLAPKGGNAPIASSSAMGGGGGAFANMRGAIFPSGGGAGWATAAQYGIQAVSKVVNTIDNRTQSAYPKMLQNDQLAVLYQQTQGISQQGYYDSFRKPLQGQRLGAGGINTLLGLQAQTGINAQTQVGGVAAIRAMSGYAYGTSDVAQMLQTLASPQVNNRLSMTLGTGIYGLGGKQRSITQVMQNIIKGSGLTNERMVQGAMQQGSMSRARLSALGVPEDMQNLVLQYAQENIQFQKKTGGRQGMYNPENAGQRRTMGIEGNLATQKEETTRLSELRDEKFYNRQKDNYAEMEKNTQALIKLQTSIEELASGLIGKRISTRGSMGMRIAKGIGGVAMIGGAAALEYFSGGAATPIAAGLAMAGASTVASAFTGGPTGSVGPQGDPMPNGKKNMPSASKGLGGSKSTSGLNASFRGRLESMMKDNPNVGVSDGYRSSEDQRRLFMSRYTKTNEETDVYWGGTYWKKRGGVADAAPPGMSMHELGLAADLSGDIAWVEKNASKYGLRTSGGVGEPWHVQPKEVPESRAKYEAMGAPLGRNLKAAPFDKSARFGGDAEHTMRDRTRNASSRASNYAKMGGGVPGRAATVGGGNMIPKFGVVDNSAVAVNTADAFVQKALGQRGHPYKFGEGHDIGNPNEYSFDCSGLVLWAAQQSGYTGLGNTNAQGIYQYAVDHNSTMSVEQALKTKGALLFGKKGDKVSHVAISLGDGTTMEAKSTASGVDVFPARGGWDAAAMLPGMGASSAPTTPVSSSSNPKGDPMSAPTRGGGSATVYQGGGITISPNIYITSSGSNTMDAKRAAQEIAALLTQDIKKAAMRSL